MDPWAHGHGLLFNPSFFIYHQVQRHYIVAHFNIALGWQNRLLNNAIVAVCCCRVEVLRLQPWRV